MAPVLSAIMVAARAGSGMAAQLGNMRATEQIDALETMARLADPVPIVSARACRRVMTADPRAGILRHRHRRGLPGGRDLLSLDPGVFFDRIQYLLDKADLVQGLVK